MSAVDVRAVGLAVVALGGGRTREDDPVDHSVGLTDVAAPGEAGGPGRAPAGDGAREGRGERRARATEALREAYDARRRAAEEPRVGRWRSSVIPKAELHVHLEGTAPPDLIRRIAERNGLELPGRAVRGSRPLRLPRLPRLPRHLRQGRQRHPHRRGLPRHHLRVPREVRRRGRDLRRAHRLARPRRGSSASRDEEHVDGIARGIDDARDEAGIEGRILISCVRNFGVESGAARRPLRRRAPAPVHRRLLDGGRRGELPARRLRGARSRSPPAPGSAARSTPASGRARESVRAALELPVTRIAHGVRAIEDPALVEELAERGIVPRVLPHEQRRPRASTRATRSTRCRACATRA